MKQLIALLLVLSIAWNILAEAAVYISFKINQDYIAKNLCINRDNPESDCHGCCQLKKEIQEQQESREETPQTESKKSEILYFSHENTFNSPVAKFENKFVLPSFESYAYSSVDKIFRPPKTAS